MLSCIGACTYQKRFKNEINILDNPSSSVMGIVRVKARDCSISTMDNAIVWEMIGTQRIMNEDSDCTVAVCEAMIRLGLTSTVWSLRCHVIQTVTLQLSQ